MSYLVIENFVGGLDTRRHILTSKPGSAVKLVNAHITRGGEIEKRKIFQLYKTLPVGTFGLESCGGKLYTFGSADLASQVPTGITYQRLRHPDSIFAMTKVVSFTSYNGKTFVIAEFTDGNRYGYYDSEIIPDFYNGVARASHLSINGLLNDIVNLFPSGYMTSVVNDGLIIEGPQGTEFSLSVSTSGTITSGEIIKTRTSVKPIPEVKAKGSFTITGGSNTSSSASFALRQHLYENMPRMVGLVVGGKEILGLATSSAGLTYNSAPGTYGDVGQQFSQTMAYFINLNSGNSNFTASYYYGGGGWNTRDPGSWTVYGDPSSPESTNGDELWAEFNSVPSYPGSTGGNPGDSMYDYSQVKRSDCFRPGEDPLVPNGRWMMKLAANMAGGYFSGLNEIHVDGVDILGQRVTWLNSNTSTANTVADAINGYTSIPEYLATAIEGGKVQLTASDGMGASANGQVVNVIATGTATISTQTNMSGGVDPIGGISQRNIIPFGGTFTPGSTISITITETENPENPIYVGATRLGGLKPAFCLTFKTKVHVLAESYLISSGLDKPTGWKISDLGSSFIDMSNNINGSQDLVSACSYQGKMAIFTRDTCQIWTIDVDSANNLQGQVILNSGCLAPYSVIGWGEVDVFYMSDSGIRSLRARDASNQAVVNDIGTPVDSEIISELRAHTTDEVFLSKSIIEPKDGRLMITIGERLYVLSQFPSSSILAWSTYEPGFSISNMCVDTGKLYVRSTDNKVYLYGGTDGNTYDSSIVTVELPYLDGTKPASQKHLQGIDMTSDGTWEFYIGTDTYNPEVRDFIATIDSPTLQVGRIPAYGIGTHVGVKLIGIGSGYCRVANIIVHYELNEAD